MRIGARRWGGNNATSYNWQLDVKNIDADWYFENFPAASGGTSAFNQFHERNLQTGTLSLGTVPILDWTPKQASGCSFSVAKYGAQKAVDPYNKNCGNGVLPNGQNIVNDPNDAYQPIDSSFVKQWVQSILNKYGPANQGGVQMWSLDNEPEWWDQVHMDMLHQPAGYDDMLARDIAAAQAVKAADPTAMITGPVPGGWSGMLFSKKDMIAGWSKSPYVYWDNPVDQKAHGGVPWIPYYLQQMQQFEQTHGYRLLDVLDVHAYINSDEVTQAPGNSTMETLRMTSTRAFWDPNYITPNTNAGNKQYDATGAVVAPQLIPRLHQWVDQNYPGTKLAITEYDWGAPSTITGAIAQADLLGIFGREALDMATLWPEGSPNDVKPGLPAAFAFQMFLNYDGAGNQFGETSVSASTDDPDTLSIFAAQRSDTAVTVLVLNKTNNAVSTSVALANFTPAASAEVWQYSGSDLTKITRQPDAAVSASAIPATFPPLSMTLLVIPAAQSSMSVPQPVVTSVASAASYDAGGIAPGEIVVIFGKSLAPAGTEYLQLDSSGLVSKSLAGVRVLFDGVPAPMIYTTARQLSAVVPYEIGLAGQTQVHVQVENQGNRSATLVVPIANTLPAIFTSDFSGSGQGAILNNEIVHGRYVVNGPANPAARGSVVMIYATGEGTTNPPGIDGRVASSILPKPNGTNCSVSIGGIAAVVSYCGAAPLSVAGLIQVNAQVPDSVASGNAVPVQVSIGGKASQPGVTIAVQ